MLHRSLVLFGSFLVATAVAAQEPNPTPAADAAEEAYKLYGWLQAGFTANFDSPADRINFGANFNWRSNDFRLNQLDFVLEKPLEQNRADFGYRIDFLVGHDAPFLAANGLFDRITGLDATSGVGLESPSSYRNVNRIGIDLPQFYVELSIPRFITDKGIDLRVGKFYTLLGREVYPAPDTDFYSRTYENVVGTPFTHTGVLATVHASDTLDVVAGVVVGWDVFEDNNGRPSYQAALIWNSSDQRFNWTTVGIIGPEQVDNDDNDRTLVTSYLTMKFGDEDRWLLATGGHIGHDENAVSDAAGGSNDAEWYAYSVHLLYALDPKIRLGFRAEWFRDDDAARTGILKRPGFAASFYDVTLGFAYSLCENLRVRPEVRLDWTSDARPFNGQADKSQVTAAFDVVWKF